MKRSQSGNATAILLIIALAVGIASTALIITITKTNPQTKTSAAAPVTTLLPTVPKSSGSAEAKFSALTTPTSPTIVATPTATLAPGTVQTQTLLSTDRTTLAVDFIASSFTSINTITYTITYTADVSGAPTAKNIQGTFALASTLVTGYKTSGNPYIKKTFTLGTCSGSVCTYDLNPRTFAVSVSVL